MRHEPASAAELHRVTVRGVGLPVPGHLSPLFSTDQGGLRQSVPFLAEGIRLGQPAFLVASGAELERYLEAFASHGVDIDTATKRGLFHVVSFEGGTVAEAIAEWEQSFAEVLTRHGTLLRIVGDMVSERTMFVSEDEMLRYEEAFEVMCRRYPVVVLCQYDVRQFTGSVLLRMLKAHPDMHGSRIGAFLN